MVGDEEKAPDMKGRLERGGLGSGHAGEEWGWVAGTKARGFHGHGERGPVVERGQREGRGQREERGQREMGVGNRAGGESRDSLRCTTGRERGGMGKRAATVSREEELPFRLPITARTLT